jgi:hypothetical protein
MMRLVLNQTRKRVAGILSRAKRGLVLTTTEEHVWNLGTEENYDGHVEGKVIVDCVVVGLDRLKVDWIGQV